MATTDPHFRLSIVGQEEVVPIDHLEDLDILGTIERTFPLVYGTSVPISLTGAGGSVDKVICKLPYSSTVTNTGKLTVAYSTSGFYNSRDLLNEISGDYTAHIALTTSHPVADTVNVLDSTDRVISISDVYLMVNDIKEKFNAHITDALLASPAYHAATGTDYTVSSADADSLSTLLTLVNDIKTQYELHRVDVAAHTVADSTNTITTADSSDPGAESFDLQVSKLSVWNPDEVFGSFITQITASTEEEDSFKMIVRIYTKE